VVFDFQVDDEDDEKAVIGFWSAFSWLVGMTLVISVLSEYVVGTIEVKSTNMFILVFNDI
jgi:Ca2+:H+ antiporter